MKMNKKIKNIILIVASIISVVGVIVIAKFGLNTTLEYSNSIKIQINLGQDYNINDIKDIANDSLGKNYKIQKVEIFNESVVITKKDISDEELQTLKDKINVKYQLEDVNNAVVKSEMPGVDIASVAKTYVIPGLMILAACMVYLVIKYYKVGILVAMYDLIKNVVLSQGLFFAVLALTRIPVGNLLMPVSSLIFVFAILATITELKSLKPKVKKANNDKEQK